MNNWIDLEEEKYKVCMAMNRFGGSFFGALGVALACADPINTAKIKSAFPEYWQKYLDMYNQHLEDKADD